MNRSVLLAALLVLAAAPVGAHEPASTTFLRATAVPEGIMDLDGDFDEDAWDDAAEVKFSAPATGKTAVSFAWVPEDDEIWVAIDVRDDTDDGADDYIDFAFAFDHDEDDADDDEQVILRAHRDGTLETISVEDADDPPTAGAPDDVSADVTDEGTSGYLVEILIEWKDVHAGWAIWQFDDDENDETEYPEDADREEPDTWTDVKGVKLSIDLALRMDKTTAKLDDTLSLTASIDDFDDLIDFDEKIRFDRYDGTKWTEIVAKTPDDDGDAKTTTKVSATGALKYRARIAETALYAESLSNEVTVTVADAATKIYGDASLFVKYTSDADGGRTYTILANTTTSFMTVEVSPDGDAWTRIAKGDKGTPLTAVWTAPDNGVWHIRSVAYDAAGKAGKAVKAEAAAHALPGTRTVTTVTLDVDKNGTGVDLVATVAPAAASGSVTFYRAPNVVLGTGTLASGVARLSVAHALPGEQTYVARYGGSTSHLPSADRAAHDAWPKDAEAFSPRTEDASGEKISLRAEEGSVVFSARAGEGPGLAGVVKIVAAPEEGHADTLYRGATSGDLTVDFVPKVPGTYTVTAEFYRAKGTGVAADVRSVSAEGADREVEVVVDVPQTAAFNATIEVLVRLDPAPNGGNVTLLVDGEVVDNASAAEEVAFAWTADAAGTRSLSARYSGAPGYASAVSDHVQVVVAGDGPGGDPGDDGDDADAGDGGGVKTPGVAWLGAVAALGVAAWNRKK